MEVRYKTAGRTPRVGMGQTSRMSNSEVVFTADQPLEAGTNLEISIAWPALLNGRVALQLVVVGDVVGRRDSLTTVRIRKYHFRTRGRQTEFVQASAVAYQTASAGLRFQQAACG
jgi:hypothetical protein